MNDGSEDMELPPNRKLKKSPTSRINRNRVPPPPLPKRKKLSTSEKQNATGSGLFSLSNLGSLKSADLNPSKSVGLNPSKPVNFPKPLVEKTPPKEKIDTPSPSTPTPTPTPAPAPVSDVARTRDSVQAFFKFMNNNIKAAEKKLDPKLDTLWEGGGPPSIVIQQPHPHRKFWIFFCVGVALILLIITMLILRRDEPTIRSVQKPSPQVNKQSQTPQVNKQGQTSKILATTSPTLTGGAAENSMSSEDLPENSTKSGDQHVEDKKVLKQKSEKKRRRKELKASTNKVHLPKKLSRKKMRRVMRSARHQIRKCFRRYGKRGRAKVRVVIHPEGFVGSVRIKGKYAKSSLGDCIRDEVSAARFPPFKGQRTKYTYTYVVRR